MWRNDQESLRRAASESPIIPALITETLPWACWASAESSAWRHSHGCALHRRQVRRWWQSRITWVHGVMNDLKFSHLKKRNYAFFFFFSFLFCAKDYMHLSARNCLYQIWSEVLWLSVLKDFSVIIWCWSRLDRTICDGLTSCHLYSGLILRNLEWRSDETSLCVSEEHVKKGFSIARRVSCFILKKLSRHLSNKGEIAHWIPCTFATCYISNSMYNIRVAITFWPISDHGSQFGFKLLGLGEGRLKQKSWRRL